MTVDDLLRQIMTPARRRAVKSVAGKGGLVTGLAGSSAAMMLSTLAPGKKGSPTVVVGDNLDDAGYLYFDSAA